MYREAKEVYLSNIIEDEKGYFDKQIKIPYTANSV